VTIGASYGAAYLAALATGLANEHDHPDGWVRIVDRIEPDERVRPTYDRLYGLYRRLYRDTAAVNHALARSQAPAGAGGDLHGATVLSAGTAATTATTATTATAASATGGSSGPAAAP
jgi:hypothetical protein